MTRVERRGRRLFTLGTQRERKGKGTGSVVCPDGRANMGTTRVNRVGRQRTTEDDRGRREDASRAERDAITSGCIRQTRHDRDSHLPAGQGINHADVTALGRISHCHAYRTVTRTVLLRVSSCVGDAAIEGNHTADKDAPYQTHLPPLHALFYSLEVLPRLRAFLDTSCTTMHGTTMRLTSAFGRLGTCHSSGSLFA